MTDPTPTFRRALAAAALAAALLSPARAQNPPLSDCQLDAIFGQNSRCGRQVSGPVAPVRNAPPGLLNRDNTPAPQPPGNGTIDQAEIDRYIVMDGKFNDAERQFVRQVTDRLGQSAEGRRILRALLDDCKKQNTQILVRPMDWQGSVVVNDGGIESINGLNGMENDPVGKPKVFMFNRKYMDFRDRSNAVDSLAAVMGHELSHMELHLTYRERLEAYQNQVFEITYPDRSKDKSGRTAQKIKLNVLSLAVLDEQNARVKGFVVAMELNNNKPTSEIRQAMEMARDIPRYYANMKTWDVGYAISLQQRELRAPIHAYDERLAALASSKSDREGNLARGYSLLTEQINHMQTAHADWLAAREAKEPAQGGIPALRARLQLLKDKVPKWIEYDRHEVDELQEAMDLVNAIKSYMKTQPNVEPVDPQADCNSWLCKRLNDLSRDPEFSRIVGGVRNDEKRLKELTDNVNIPAPPVQTHPLGWAELRALFKELHGTDGPGPWNEPPRR